MKYNTTIFIESFSKADVSSFEAAERVLRELKVAYEKTSDGHPLVLGDLDLSHKNIFSLPDLSCVSVQGSFYCKGNHLTSLKGAPFFVCGSFVCDNNQLISLEGAPVLVGKKFTCTGNKLTSLNGAPSSIGDSLWCNRNPLISLEGISPQMSGIILSDLGDFSSWSQVPENLRVSPETIERLKREKDRQEREFEERIRKSAILQRNMPLPKPLRFPQPK